MKAVLCSQWGGPQTLSIGEAASPQPAPGEILVGVRACGLNFADTLMIQGKYQERPEFPFSPGLEVSGEVLALGGGVEDFSTGDSVIAFCGHGGLAEQVAVPAGNAVHMPAGLEFVVAAGFGVVYGTAHVALHHRARLQPGEVLLVHGAAGGVGLAAVEVGRRMGASVIATAGSADKLALAAEHGAEHTINYREESFRDRVKELTDGRGADVVFDPVGGEVFDESLRCINWEGRILVVGFASGTIPQFPVNLALVKNMSVVGVYWGAYRKRDAGVLQRSWRQLFEWLAEGALSPHVSATYPLEEAPAALESLSSRRSTGKVVVTIGR
ncbi:MAG: NADPH:quinone oxidoreductase family protein [Gammaproteobacteria bacterium]|nr:NADPH:quinone oxidoreductase family protein [Gammaproteobacteria bacterium]